MVKILQLKALQKMKPLMIIPVFPSFQPFTYIMKMNVLETKKQF